MRTVAQWNFGTTGRTTLDVASINEVRKGAIYPRPVAFCPSVSLAIRLPGQTHYMGCYSR
jgi:hypothetical protein